MACDEHAAKTACSEHPLVGSAHVSRWTLRVTVLPLLGSWTPLPSSALEERTVPKGASGVCSGRGVKGERPTYGMMGT